MSLELLKTNGVTRVLGTGDSILMTGTVCVSVTSIKNMTVRRTPMVVQELPCNVVIQCKIYNCQGNIRRGSTILVLKQPYFIAAPASTIQFSGCGTLNFRFYVVLIMFSCVCDHNLSVGNNIRHLS